MSCSVETNMGFRGFQSTFARIKTVLKRNWAEFKILSPHFHLLTVAIQEICTTLTKTHSDILDLTNLGYTRLSLGDIN